MRAVHMFRNFFFSASIMHFCFVKRKGRLRGKRRLSGSGTSSASTSWTVETTCVTSGPLPQFLYCSSVIAMSHQHERIALL